MDFPSPDSASFHRTLLGFGVYADESNAWAITDEVLFQVDNQYKTIIECSENVLAAEIAIIIEPAVQASSLTVRGYQIDTESPSQKIRTNEGEEDKDSLDMFPGVVEKGRTLTGFIAGDFKVILVSKDACIGEKGVEGAYRYLGDSLTIWVNQVGDELGHEWEHILARVLDITEEEEEKLYSCTPNIEHIDF